MRPAQLVCSLRLAELQQNVLSTLVPECQPSINSQLARVSLCTRIVDLDRPKIHDKRLAYGMSFRSARQRAVIGLFLYKRSCNDHYLQVDPIARSPIDLIKNTGHKLGKANNSFKK